MVSWKLYEKRTTGKGEVVATLYDNGRISLWNEAGIDCSVEVSDFEELKELTEILNGMVKAIENRKLKELAKNEHNR